MVHVAKQGENILGNPKEGEALEYLFRISKEAGADMTVLRAERIVDTLVDFARKNEITIVVMGESPYSKSDTSIIRQLEVRLPDIEIKVIPA